MAEHTGFNLKHNASTLIDGFHACGRYWKVAESSGKWWDALRRPSLVGKSPSFRDIFSTSIVYIETNMT